MSLGKAARRSSPRSGHAAFIPDPNRDPIALLQRQAAEREPLLVPLRHQRMAISPFTYFRGAALPMAWDLARGPSTGIQVQLCGDAHLSNFGVFGTPERHLNFDLNDFDETLPGPFEWDLKRLVASLEIAGRDLEFRAPRRRDAVASAVRSYREAMAAFAGMSSLDVWYSHLDVERLRKPYLRSLDRVRTPAVWKAIEKARAHDSMQAFDRLTRIVDGEHRIVFDPPLIVPLDRTGGIEPDRIREVLASMAAAYRKTLPWDRRHLLERYRIADAAHKVVGVGSVGTRCWIVLLLDRQTASPLFLQVKEARASVLEEFLPKSAFGNHGERVVVGQRLMQAASDVFLGWVRHRDDDGSTRDHYVRQLRDWKGSAEVTNMSAAGLSLHAEMCGWTLARAHARSGDRATIAAYLGASDAFDRALTEFATAYADQNARDHAELLRALEDGRLAR